MSRLGIKKIALKTKNKTHLIFSVWIVKYFYIYYTEFRNAVYTVSDIYVEYICPKIVDLYLLKKYKITRENINRVFKKFLIITNWGRSFKMIFLCAIRYEKTKNEFKINLIFIYVYPNSIWSAEAVLNHQ